MNQADKKQPIPVREQGAEWLVALDNAELSTAKKQDFLDWLRESPTHIKEFLQLSVLHIELERNERLQSTIDELVAAANTDIVELHPPTRIQSTTLVSTNREETPKVSYRWFGIAASLIAVMATLTWLLIEQSGQVYQTALGEQQSVVLEDGSMIVLNVLSEARVTFTDRSRRVTLGAGEVFFDVAKDAARPFVVDAGPMHLTVVGTRFNVYRQPDQTVVSVVEGKIGVSTMAAASATTPSRSKSTTMLAIAGEQVVIAMNGGVVTREKLADIEEITAWTKRKLVFRDKPLAEVVAEFNRYSYHPLIIGDPELATRPITGVFSTHDIELLGVFLDNQPGIEIRREKESYHVLRSVEGSSAN